MDNQSAETTRDPNGEPMTRQSQCSMHGMYESRRHGDLRWKLWSRCQKCEMDLAARQEQQKRETTEQLAAEALHKRLALSGLSPRFKTVSFDDFLADTREKLAARTACRSFVEALKPSDSAGLWLVGPPGTGKTHLGCAMVNHIVRVRKSYAAIHSAREIVRMLRAGWGDRASGRQEAEVLEDLGHMALLVIDEVGVGFGSESEMVQLFDVIDMRYRNEKPTVLISNLSAKELKPVLGDAAYDRLREGAVLVPCNWKSHRQGQGA